MRRRHIHALFGVAALGFGLLAGHHGLRLRHAAQVNESIARANAAELEDSVSEAQFARALALSKAGEYDAAVKAYKALIQGGRADLRIAAMYNLGNIHMREASKDGSATGSPLVELAKQSYRDVLRENPADWDARYNLERALWLAPEVDEAQAEDNNPPEFRRRVVLPAQGFKLDLP
jgi:mxaK protein